MSPRATSFASFVLLAGLLCPAGALAQSGVTFGGGASSESPPPPAAPPPPPPPASGAAPAAPPPLSPSELGQAAPPPDEDALVATEWVERDEAINESSTLTGGTGLLKTQHAQTGMPGQFRLGFVTEYFKASFLCTTKYPCPSIQLPNGQATGPQNGDTMTHSGGTLSLGVSVAKLGAGTLDAYGAITAFSNSDTANQPSLLQALGDITLGLKYVAPIGNVVHLGLFTELWLINGTGSVGIDGSGTSAKFGGVGTLDLRGLESKVPLRFSLNTVYFLDNTGQVLQATEQQLGQPVSRIDRFGLGVNRVDTFDILIGGEVFLADERVRPFIEEKIGIPNNRQKYQCHTKNPSDDQCLLNDSVIPSTLTIGSRFFPWKRGFSLLAALDIGTGGTGNFIEELAPTPPWTLYLGAGWAVDTQDRPPVVKTKLVEKPVEKAAVQGHVTGFVHEKDKNDPVPGALVSYRDRTDLSPLSTGPDGKFGDDLPPGQYTYDIKAESFKPGSCDVTVPKEGGSIPIDCALEALPRMGIVNGHARDADTSQPVAGVQIILQDSAHKELRLTTDPSGGFRFDGVTPGTATLSVTADAYLVVVAPADVKARQENTVDLMLRPKPKTSLVQVGKGEITIKQQVQFALDSAVILPESFGLLTEIADTLIRHSDLRHVEVQGHTDNSGTPEHNKVLSEQRADAVRAWLVQHGVPSDKLVARGYGQEKPLAPNVTAGNRARNRRVQLIILDQDAGLAPPPAPGERQKHPLPGF